MLLVGQQPLPDGVGHRRYLDRCPLASPDLVHAVSPTYHHVGNIQRAKDLDAGSSSFLGRQVVIAHQQYDRDTGIGQALDAPGKLAAVGRVGVAGLVGVAGKEDQVHLVLQRILDDLAQPPQKVHDPAIEPRNGIEPAIIFHAYVQIGQMQDSDTFH